MFRGQPHTPGAKPLLNLLIYPGSARLLGPQGGTPPQPMKSVPGSLWVPEPVPNPTYLIWVLFPVKGKLLTHSVLRYSFHLTYSNFPFNLFSRPKMGAPGRGRGAKPSPAAAPLTPASSRPSSAPGRSGEPTPPKQTTSAPGTAPEPEDVIPIPSDPSHGARDGEIGRAHV